jgi:uncharacterized protein (TIGR03663 family)
MHTDESVNAYLTGELLAGGKFHYDPQDRHGPALFVVAEPLARLLGVKNFSELTETQLRLSTVLTGTATVLLFGAGVEMFGFIACLVAALLFAFAPLPVYYSRYFIHETLFVAATLGLILSGWCALKKNSLLPAALAGLCAALMLACKETAVIHFFAIGVALLACRWRGSRNPGAARNVGVQASACLGNTLKRELQLAAVVAGAPSVKTYLTALTVFIFIVILLFTWFGQNWAGLADLFRAIPRFAARAGGEGHEKPFWYYAGLLGGGWSGAVILGLAAAGIFAVARSRRRGNESLTNKELETPHVVAYGFENAAAFFILIYGSVITVIYSAIPYKTPWLALNFWLPLAILAGIASEWIWFATRKFSARVLILVFVVMLGFLLARDTQQRVFVNPADEKNPYAYAHTGEDLLRLPGRLEELARQDKISNPRIAVVAADAWPLPWYLRKFPQTGFWQPEQETGAADFFITTTDVSGKLAERLKDFRPEFFGARPNLLLILWSPLETAPSHE